LFKRGLWLILLEFTMVNFGLFFDIGFHIVLFEVIATIGLGFIVLGLLLKIPAKVIGILGIIVIACHNLFPSLPLDFESNAMKFISPFFIRAGIPIDATHVFVMAYPPIPWLGIMCAGFGAGLLFKMEQTRRRKLLMFFGIAAISIFLLLRSINIYGDPVPWAIMKDPMFTVLSFVNVTKYPPSLLFCCVTLGITLLLLAFTENARGRLSEVVSTYGKVPLFYFVVHFYVIHLILLCILLFQGIAFHEMEFAGGTFGRPRSMPTGLPLSWIYIIWIAVVAVLYKPCRWYASYKQTHSHWWLRYL
ncbi:MAG TPA: hypothetical protein VGB43_03285, partial [Flavobacterium sp.]